VSVRFTPPTPPRQPRLEHVRGLWQMHRPQRSQAILTAALYQTDTGRELCVAFTIDNLIHSELSRKRDEPVEARAEDLRLILLGRAGSNFARLTPRTERPDTRQHGPSSHG
jgi:hypothetical protein